MPRTSTSFSKDNPGPGRPRGQRNRYSKALVARMKETGYTEPLDILLMMANDASLDPDTRRRAAKDACPYVHRRKPQALEVGGRFEFLTPEEREMRKQLLLDEIRVRAARAARISSDN